MDMTSRPVRQQPYIRPVAGSDWPAVAAFYAALDDEARRSRFLGCTWVSAEAAQRMCAVDHRRAEGLVACTVEPDGSERICAHLCMEPCGHGMEELAVAVAADWRGMGLGRRLVDAGLEWARDHDVARVTATAFATNSAVLRLLVGSTPGVTTHAHRGGTVDIDIPVRDA